MLLDIMQPIFSCQNRVNPDLPYSALTLYIEIGQYHIAVYSVNKSGNIFTEYELFNTSDRIHADTVTEFLKNNNVFQKKYQNLIFLHHSPESVLIPRKLYMPGTEKKIIELVHGDAIEYTICKDSSVHTDIVHVYAIDAKIHTATNELFSDITHTHIDSVLLKEINDRSIEQDSETIDLIFYPSSVHMTVLKGKEVQLMQTYFLETKDDLSFYLLSAINHFGLNTDLLSVRVCGFIKNDDLFMHTIRQCISQVETINPPITISIPLEANVPLHYFTPIFISTQCESLVEN